MGDKMLEQVAARVGKLEDEMGAVQTDLAVVQKELEHGSTIFHRLEKTINSLDKDFRIHMNKEEKLLIKFGGALVVFFAATIIGLIGYIWKTHVG